MPGRADRAVVRPVAAGEALALRELRLRALADAPAAFASTLAAESLLPDDHWRRLVDEAVAGEPGTIAIAVDGDALGGHGGGRLVSSASAESRSYGGCGSIRSRAGPAPAWRSSARCATGRRRAARRSSGSV